MDPDDKKFLNNLNRKFHEDYGPDDPDDPKVVPPVKIDTSKEAHILRMNFDKKTEVSVARIALLKDGTFLWDFGGVTDDMLYAMADLLKKCADERSNGDDDD